MKKNDFGLVSFGKRSHIGHHPQAAIRKIDRNENTKNWRHTPWIQQFRSHSTIHSLRDAWLSIQVERLPSRGTYDIQPQLFGKHCGKRLLRSPLAMHEENFLERWSNGSNPFH
jgi:hypothetical protein